VTALRTAKSGELSPPVAKAESAPGPAAPAQSNAKGLFFQAAAAATAVQVHGSVLETAKPGSPLGIRYKIVLKDLDGDVRNVTEKFRFSTGDQIRLALQSNTEGYLYIYLKGASKQVVQLFPDPRIQEGKNFIRAYTEYTIPPKSGKSRGWWKFDKKTGNEELLVVLSPKPIEKLEAAAPRRAEPTLDDAGWEVVAALVSEGEAAVRDISFETEAFDGEYGADEPTTGYVVTRTSVLVHRIVLRHGH
jgi:hypothetical protein